MAWLNTVRQRIADVIAPRTRAVAYEGAGHGRRFKGWNPSDTSANAAIWTDGETLRKRARDLVRQNGWAASGVEAFVSNAIGTGISPRPQHKDKAIRDLLLRLWDDWVPYSDAEGLLDFYGQQSLTGRAVYESGEGLGQMLPVEKALPGIVPLQVKLLEADHLPFQFIRSAKAEGENSIRMGIEYTSSGRRVAYHLYRSHPQDVVFSRSFDLLRVPADEMVHVFRPLRPGQQRGVTWMAQTIVKLRDLEKYDDAELVRKKMAAFFNIFITEVDAENPVLPAADQDSEQDGEGVDEVKVEPGTVVKLQPGEDIKVAEHAEIGGQYGEFMRTQLRAVAASMGVTFEQLTGDLSGVNYSSIRAGLLEFRRRIEAFQYGIFVQQFCRPIWIAWLKQAALAGLIDARDFQRNRLEYERCNWQTPRWEWVDPLKDVQAEIKAIRGGLKSREQSVAERGSNVEEIDEQNARDQERADDLGLAYDCDGRRPANGGTPPAEPQQQPVDGGKEE